MAFEHPLRRVKFRRGIRCRGVHIKAEMELISFCSAVMRPVFAWSSIKILTTVLR